ncbi:hypothetical protein BGZ61DRAFT_539136 [Ilyonectria robusta]|uniref:uncharacterized protein n=1 Tax=Ilyonectria robusta TaxID=1079257 RepID=UPI001E8DE01F|nr:uncharacterized protein BGZ61DRAFT_539136 [Ilyonectria robusta]KAH8663832.1 hypothetical protein BGZ61DRAFT_539136 [Ilyonectria robusta]
MSPIPMDLVAGPAPVHPFTMGFTGGSPSSPCASAFGAALGHGIRSVRTSGAPADTDKKAKHNQDEEMDTPKCSCNEAITDMEKELKSLDKARETLDKRLTSARGYTTAFQNTAENLKECNCGKDKLKITQSTGSPLVRTVSAVKIDKTSARNPYAGKSK